MPKTWAHPPSQREYPSAQGALEYWANVIPRWLIAVPALLVVTAMCGCAGGDEGSSAGDATATPSTIATPATAAATTAVAPSGSSSSTSTDAAGQQMCDSLKGIEAAGGATPADLAAAGEVGAESSNPDISGPARLLAAYAAAAVAGNRAGDLRGMVQDLLAACRENGYTQLAPKAGPWTALPPGNPPRLQTPRSPNPPADPGQLSSRASEATWWRRPQRPPGSSASLAG